MRILRLRLENWRNFRKLDINLQKRVFFVGPNASGKSNILDAIRFLQDVVSEGGGLREAVGRRQGVSKIRCLAARRQPDVALSVELGEGGNGVEWSYRLVFNQDNRSRPIVKEERVSNSGGAVLSRPDNEDEQDRERLAQTHLEQVSANKEFRPIVSFLNSMRYLHIVPQLIRDPHRYQVRERDFYGSDFLEQLVRTPERRREKRLAKITNALRIAVPQLKELKVVRDPTRGTPHLEGLWKHWRPNAGWQREDQFSDGTLRLLGLLWALLDGEGPLLLEEPELSLHSGVVQHIPKMFAHIAGRRGRQVIVSTHSAEILSDRSIALDEVFLLRPGPEGTDVTCAKDEEEIRILLEDKNITLGDVVIPKTTPQDSDQLGMFDQQ